MDRCCLSWLSSTAWKHSCNPNAQSLWACALMNAIYIVKAAFASSLWVSAEFLKRTLYNIYTAQLVFNGSVSSKHDVLSTLKSEIRLESWKHKTEGNLLFYSYVQDARECIWLHALMHTLLCHRQYNRADLMLHLNSKAVNTEICIGNRTH